MTPGAESRVDWDRSYLTGRAYNTDEKLATRQSIYAFSKPSKEPGFFAWGVSRIEWSGTEVVLDVGCGNGLWQKRLLQAMPGLRTIGMDLSEGMVRRPRKRLGRFEQRSRRRSRRPGPASARPIR